MGRMFKAQADNRESILDLVSFIKPSGCEECAGFGCEESQARSSSSPSYFCKGVFSGIQMTKCLRDVSRAVLQRWSP